MLDGTTTSRQCYRRCTGFQFDVSFLKLTAFSRPSAAPSGSPKSLRFGHWLTLCTIKIYMYLLTYLQYNVIVVGWKEYRVTPETRHGNYTYLFVK